MNHDIGILVTVQEVFDNDHQVVNTKGAAKGKFTFTAADAGDHRICFLPSLPGGGGWLSGGQPVGGIKLTLDLAIGETSAIESTDKGKIQDIVQKVKDLNGRLQDIRREQVFQRVRRHKRHKSGLSSADSYNNLGAGSRVSRSVRINERKSGQMDIVAACGTGCYLRLAAFTFTRFFHQAEVDVNTWSN